MRIWSLVLLFPAMACSIAATRDTNVVADASPVVDAAPIADAAPVADAAPPDAPGAQYSGELTGPGIPTEGTVIIAWFVVTETAMSRYKFGGGSSVGDQYTASLPGPLPAAAMGSNGLAVGFLALLPKGSKVPDGPLDDTIDALIIGVGHNGLVLRDASSQLPGWPAAFPDGVLSCARCVAGASSGDPDTMEPAPCSELTIDASGTTHICRPF